MLRKTVLLLIVSFFSALTMMGADKRFTLVIDAGHGGHDSGAKGAISYEKNLTLKYALAFGKAVQRGCPDVKVIFTRTTDVFLPLHERADIANRNKADLFISIHINALEPGHISRGFQSYTLGTGQRTGTKGLKENLEVAKRENSVIFMEKDYQSNYKNLENSAESDIMFEFIADKNRERSVDLSRMMQREVCKATGRVNGGSHQNNLAVLRLTSMPAILLELGFISTPDEEAFLNTDSALDLYTKGIYNAFVAYKKKYNQNVDIPYRDTSDDYNSSLIGSSRSTRSVSTDNDDDDNDSSKIVAATRSRGRRARTQGSDSKSDGSATKKQDSSSRKDNTVSRKQDNAAKKQDSSSKKQTTATKKQDNVSKPLFRIQIFSSKVEVKNNSTEFKGLKGCWSYREGSYYKYTYGESYNYNEMYRLKKTVAEKFPTALIVAFKDGKKMDVNDAINEFLENKKKGR